MSRNTDCSAPSTASTGLVQRSARPELAVYAQLLSDLVRPWRVIASQLLTMVVPLCTPEQRQALQVRADLLSGDKRPLTHDDASVVDQDAAASSAGYQSGVDTL